MTEDNRYESWQTMGSAFNRMLCADGSFNTMLEYALYFLPPVEVFDQISDKIVIAATGNVDGKILLKRITDGRHIILISERILPKHDCLDDSPCSRYFIFVVLHEVAHVVLGHRPPCDKIQEEKREDEEMADGRAILWFNEYISRNPEPPRKVMTAEEVSLLKADSRIHTELYYHPKPAMPPHCH